MLGYLHYGSGFFMDNLMVMDIINSSNFHVRLFSCLASIDNRNYNSLKWYNGLGDIGKDRMKRLAEKVF